MKDAQKTGARTEKGPWWGMARAARLPVFPLCWRELSMRYPLLALLISLIMLSSAATATLVGCGGTIRTPEQVLEEQVQAFHAHMRWRRYDDAAGFVAPATRQGFLGEYEELGRDYSITEVEIESIQLGDTREEAVVVVWVQSFRLPSTRVQEHTFRERWVYDPDLRVWQMEEREER